MKNYVIDWTKVRTVKDIKGILEACRLQISEDPENPSPQFDPIRHLIVEESSESQGA